MRVLLDECLPRKLKRTLTGHEVTTVPEAGWAGKKNGELLALAKGRFDVFITADQSLSYQQNLGAADIAVIVLKAPNTRLQTLESLMPEVLKVLSSIKPKQILFVGPET